MLALKNMPDVIQKDVMDFLEKVKTTPYLKPDGNPDKEWTLVAGDTWDNGNAIALKLQNSERDDLRNKVWDTVVGIATACERYDARCELVYATRHAVEKATRRMSEHLDAGYTIGGLKDDASLMVSLLLVKDIDFPRKQEYTELGEKIMAVWNKGYARAYEINGKQYVHTIGNTLQKNVRKS